MTISPFIQNSINQTRITAVLIGFFLWLISLNGVVFSQHHLAENPQQNTAGFSLSYQEMGLPYITTYTPNDYKAHVQNWDFIQSDNGLMYVGNTSGILEYDGISWRLIPLPNGSPAKSFAKSSDGTIYVGGVRDLGFLRPDSLGRMSFQSLLTELDSAHQNFADIWFTYAIGNDIYFISDHHVLQWQNNRFNVWHSEERFGFAGMVNGTIYIEGDKIGLMKLTGDGLSVVPDGDKFVHEPGSFTTFLPYDDDNILIGHYTEGLFLYNSREFVPFPDESLLQKKNIYNGTVLPNGDFMFTTLGNGCFIVNRRGEIKQWIGTQTGLSSNTQFGAYVDQNGNLWLAGENGINRIEISSPLRLFQQYSGLTEGVDRVAFFNNRFYAAGKDGIYFLQEVSEDPEKKVNIFQPIEGISQQTWDLYAAGEYLLAANFGGTYQIDQAHQVTLLIPENSSRILHSAAEPGRIFVGTMFGRVYSLYFRNNQWRAEETPLSVEGRILEMAENPDGSLWLSSRYNGVYKVDFPASNENRAFTDDYFVTHYTTQHGLPEMSYNSVFNIRSETYFSTLAGIYRFNDSSQTFVPDSILMDQLGTTDIGFENTISPSRDGGMWLTAKSNVENHVFTLADGVLSETTALNRFFDFIVYDVFDQGDAVFFIGPDGILGYNPQLNKNYGAHFPVLIRSVIINGDSLLYAGRQADRSSQNPFSLPFDNNTLRFSYALPDYNKPQANQYQHILEGFNENWSDWTTETLRDFTNLPEGDYQFRVRAKNVYGHISEAASFSFDILPPWYRSWWAYLLYILFFTGFIISLVKWRSYKLEQENVALQQIVEERTRQVKEQAEQLKELDEAKSRFFANISHEFRTPLTLILGQVQQLESGRVKADPKPVYNMIKRNGNRVLTLVNQLLDLSTLEAGKMQLQVQKTDLISFLNPIIAAYESLAESKNIAFRFETDEKNIPAYLDRDKMEKVVQNVISNAFKFTPEGGQITVLASTDDNGSAQIKVTDNGHGIAPGHLGKIFDRFYQAGDSGVKYGEGSGIGLALAKELVTLHSGMLAVESTVGKGSCFTISIPLGRKHLSVDEMIGEPAQTDETDVSNNVHVTEKDISEPDTVASFPEDDIPGSTELPHILVVEDNADMRKYIRQILDPYYQVEEAVHGSDGLEKATEQIPELVISDVMMPEMDGMELCKKLKNDERTSHIPVVLLTAKAGKKSKLEGLEQRADDYLTKPFDADELLVLLRNRIEQRARLRERFSREITLQPKDIAITSADERFLQRAIDIVEVNIDDFEFSVETFVEQMHLGRTQVNKKLKALTDLSAVQFIRSQRLKRAAQKIAGQEDTISQIAYSVGFNNLSYFARCFKEQFGVSPSDYS